MSLRSYFSNMGMITSLLCLTCLGLSGTRALISEDDCTEIKNFVAKYVHFINQIPLETYPVYSFCSSARSIDNYQDAVEFFQKAQTEKRCQKNLNLNSLNIFQKIFNQMTSVWEEAHCQDCVSNQNETAEFFKQYDELSSCIKMNSNPCENCAANYSHIQGFYEQLVRNREGSICFDIEDRMNQTRYAWSAEFKCCKDKQHSQMAFILFASGISSLPIIFYCMMYLITCQKEARAQAAVPLLNDQTAEVQEPEASSSSEPQLVQDGENAVNQSALKSDPKLNNLDKVVNVRQSKLIDLDNASSIEDHNTLHNLKSHDEDGDVSILKIPASNNIIDTFEN